MASKPITNTASIINSKDLFARINWLEQELNYRCTDEYSDELKALKVFVKNVEAAASVSTYDEGSELINDNYLKEYKQALKQPDKGNGQFSPVDFNGVTYWLHH